MLDSMRTILITLIVGIILVIAFASCCNSGARYDDYRLCGACHVRCDNEEYSEARNYDCLKCHKLNVCERGNDWKKRVLAESHKKNKGR